MVQFDLFGEVEQKLDERAKLREAAPAPRPPAPALPGRHAFPSDPHRHAFDLADRVISAWFSNYGGGRMDVPLGTVAALALFREPLIGEWLLSLEPAQFVPLLREIWGAQWLARPDLIEAARPLHDWVEENPDDHQLKAVQAVVHTALRGGLLHLTACDDPHQRSEADVLGPLLTGLRHKSDKKWRGEYHTPPSVSDLMAEMLLHSGPESGMTIREPALGSGGLFRSVAQAIRHRGLDPHDYTWLGNDIDRLSTACAAVNAIVWDLGPKTAIWCANSLSTGDAGVEEALARRTAVIKHRNAVVEQVLFEQKARRMLGALDQLFEGTAA